MRFGVSYLNMTPTTNRRMPHARLPEIVEVADNPWFIGVQFHPELKSNPFAPHPLFADCLWAEKEAKRLV